jgi:hypothetical protein
VNLTVAVPDPVTSIDVPASGSVLSPNFTIAGWSIDRASPAGTGINALHGYAYPAAGGSPIFLGAASYGATRPDIGGIFGQRFTPSGFSLNATLSPGTYTLVLYPRSTVSNEFVSPVVSQVTVATPVSRPALSIDTPAAGGVVGGTFDIAGWAIDLSSWTGTGIDTLHAYAYPESGGTPQFLGAAAYGSARPDVGNIFGSRFTPSGFRFTAKLNPGRYRLVVYPHSTISNTFGNPTVVQVTVGTQSALAEMAPGGPTGGDVPNRSIPVSEGVVAVSLVRHATWARSGGRRSRSGENRNSWQSS